ncbi:MAG: hypothetical protein COV30_01895 [Candidatus Yanofskybacteria bacterium CG10_big_fil_rev_8_21_14_0_10_37_15]|uniref:UDP-N-acetylmuramoyl-tripeptide--D-alanyl-D-alanine ligase n=1 Tax=Candidatus Yanofskybacteria bacterium CG10_big_fil_rev_8_21_14_0_10_37_15 TaxID=1975097 RepID=A0A2H0R5H7_9BACT|nr:MAG: hypothetical protein COV30_01895 [Candidatus Yanofskybacteria bacterium CG10_big_fil_rev_8_21_14_0_10_37_15]
MNLIKKIIIWKLEVLAKMYLKRFKPQIVAITGNVGKTSTKEAISAVLSRFKRVRTGKGNLNNEFGVPLTIIGDWADDYYQGGNVLFFWFRVLVVSFLRLFFEKNYPEILILEYGADKPGDIKKLVSKFKPDIGVVTAIGEIPVHVEFFSGSKGVAMEKSRLVEALSASDFAVLNFDDLAVLEMKEKTKAKISSYGFGDGATVQVSNFEPWIKNGLPEGVDFKINYSHLSRGGGQGFVPFKIRGSLGKSQGYAAAAATAVGLIFKMNLIDISESLSEYQGPKGRLKILKGIKNSVIIDDTYNASPLSAHLALETLRDLPAVRRIAVLGDMLELGKYSIQAHQEVGNMAGSFVDLLVCVGPKAKFIADSATPGVNERSSGRMTALNQMPSENIYKSETSEEAKKIIKKLLKEGDVILVKGSQGMRMEKIVEEIMAEPQNSKSLLVRQGKKWLAKQ